MRILMTADAVGGVWQYATDLAASLVPHGIETVLATLGPPATAAQRGEAAAVPGLTLVETGLPLDWLCDEPGPVQAAGEAIRALAEREGVGLVHLNQPCLAAETSYPVPVVAVIHGCVATWWDAAHGTQPDRAFAWQARLVRAGLMRADAVVAPSASYAAIVARCHRLPTPPLTVHNGRAALPVPTGLAQADHVLTAGRLWDQVKRVRLLDEAAGRIAWPMLAAGPLVAPHGETIRLRHARSLGTLSTPDLAAQLARRPIFVSSASFEPFGLSVLEAAAAGCALVLSGIDTFRELWTGAALFVDPDDADGFAAAIGRVIADQALRQHMGEAARIRAARYTPDAMAGAMASIYAGLLGAAKPSAKVAA